MKGSEGYFLAKREVQYKLEGRIGVLKEKLELLRKEGKNKDLTPVLMEIEITENIRSHMRNTLLWDTKNGD